MMSRGASDAYIEADGEVVNICYGNALPYDIEEVFDSCHRQLVANGVDLYGDHLSVTMAVACSKFPIAADLDSVGVEFSYLAHREHTPAQVIAIYLSTLARHDLEERYPSFRRVYKRQCKAYESNTELQAAAIIAAVVEDERLDPSEDSGEWTTSTP